LSSSKISVRLNANADAEIFELEIVIDLIVAEIVSILILVFDDHDASSALARRIQSSLFDCQRREEIVLYVYKDE
jgi:hypothetical protein